MTESLFYQRLTRIITWIESALSVLFFAGMFGAIIIQVFFRYVLKYPLVWPYELSIYCFIYVVFLGAAVASRRNSHIVFCMVYDQIPVRKRLIVSIVTNCLTVIVILLIFPSTFSFIRFMGHIRSSSMGIPMYVVLASFPLGMGLVVVYSMLWAIRYAHEFRSLRGH